MHMMSASCDVVTIFRRITCPFLMASCVKYFADVDVLGPLVAALDVAPPFDAGRGVLVMLGRCTVLSKAHAAKQCAQRDDLLGNR